MRKKLVSPKKLTAYTYFKKKKNQTMENLSLTL